MAKRAALSALALLLCAACAFAELTVERNEGELFLPDESNWVYHFTYAYPRIVGDDYTAALINDTYQMALDEMTRLVLPMFANAPEMRFDGKNEVKHDFTVACNNGKLLSIVQLRSQTMGEETVYSLEPLTFDVGGMYAGETLTLRGVILIQAGVDPEQLEDVRPEDYPEIAHIIQGSSSSVAEALMPILYRAFLGHPDLAETETPSYEDFEIEFSPTHDFAASQSGNYIAFYYPPMLPSKAGQGNTVILLSPADIEAILAAGEEAE
ncbi:MAG: hypothetical protein IK099_03415 [Clostridia bacterium]|nr:hypothetical protein [Clostridia bacterium]